MGAGPDGRGFVRVGVPQNMEAVSLTVGPITGGGVLQVKDKAGVGVTIGPRQANAGAVGDMCVNSARQKGICFSMLAAKSMMPY
jgi:hypothetical protein